MQKTQRFRWKRILIATAVGTLTIAAVIRVNHEWRKRDGWCVRFHSDGQQQILYSADCWK